ncbi:hypothetical protein L211DRAFT_851034 [Terfezia boudieri ATCC MYA-4762]|uniref:Uncharacterized protein n=1 Tax=Terfezia boudieri ATCC MYA-4762 TaxID=1051890 RepID=A0A3N4LK14_9PEZI|nr:hypothetical protein L211DRAFT_851034 [Terfezia boudieri ATCC MYA-4762]
MTKDHGRSGATKKGRNKELGKKYLIKQARDRLENQAVTENWEPWIISGAVGWPVQEDTAISATVVLQDLQAKQHVHTEEVELPSTKVRQERDDQTGQPPHVPMPIDTSPVSTPHTGARRKGNKDKVRRQLKHKAFKDWVAICEAESSERQEEPKPQQDLHPTNATEGTIAIPLTKPPGPLHQGKGKGKANAIELAFDTVEPDSGPANDPMAKPNECQKDLQDNGSKEMSSDIHLSTNQQKEKGLLEHR